MSQTVIWREKKAQMSAMPFMQQSTNGNVPARVQQRPTPAHLRSCFCSATRGRENQVEKECCRKQVGRWDREESNTGRRTTSQRHGVYMPEVKSRLTPTTFTTLGERLYGMVCWLSETGSILSNLFLPDREEKTG